MSYRNENFDLLEKAVVTQGAEHEEFRKISRYDKFKTTIGRTPLFELKKITIPNKNRIFAKLEYENPGGSHYDRVYVELLQRLEIEGKIKPGYTHLVETSSGNAGASFAYVAARLGYECSVIIPADVAEARKRQIQDRRATLILSPAGEYVQGAIRCLRLYLSEHKGEYKAGTLFCPNHSQDPLSPQSLSPIADEISNDLKTSGLRPDILIMACGNGTSILGVGGRFKQLFPDGRCVAFDPFEAPVAFESRQPGRFEREYDLKPENQSHRHRILGTGVWGVHFPHIKSKEFSEIVDDVYLVRDEGLVQAEALLDKQEHLYPGRSSAASLSVALQLAETICEANIVVIFYDELNYYP